jgi:hypothetical protein
MFIQHTILVPPPTEQPELISLPKVLVVRALQRRLPRYIFCSERPSKQVADILVRNGGSG